MTNKVIHTVTNSHSLTTQSFDWLTLLGPVLSFIAALIAVAAVVWSQRQLDNRQRKDHKLSTEMKTNELIFEKKEVLVKTISELQDRVIEVSSIFIRLNDEDMEISNKYKTILFEKVNQITELTAQCNLLVTLYFNHLTNIMFAIKKPIGTFTSFALNNVSETTTSKTIELREEFTEGCMNVLGDLSKAVIFDDHNNINLFKR